MRQVTLFLTALLLSSLFSAPVFAMRCGSRLVRVGQTPSQLRASCGAPDDVTRTQIAVTDAASAKFSRYRVGQSRTRVIQVEHWVYTQGGNRFPREVTFHDGRIVRVRRLRGR